MFKSNPSYYSSASWSGFESWLLHMFVFYLIILVTPLAPLQTKLKPYLKPPGEGMYITTIFNAEKLFVNCFAVKYCKLKLIIKSEL